MIGQNNANEGDSPLLHPSLSMAHWCAHLVAFIVVLYMGTILQWVGTQTHYISQALGFLLFYNLIENFDWKQGLEQCDRGGCKGKSLQC